MVNTKGGVNGQKIELIALDDKFDQARCRKRARKLIEENNVLAFFLNPGHPAPKPSSRCWTSMAPLGGNSIHRGHGAAPASAQACVQRCATTKT